MTNKERGREREGGARGEGEREGEGGCERQGVKQNGCQASRLGYDTKKNQVNGTSTSTRQVKHRRKGRQKTRKERYRNERKYMNRES